MAYIIHNSSQRIRRPLVEKLIEITSANIFEAIMLKKGVDGCRESHTAVYKLVNKDDPVIVFEDDCEVIDKTFMNLIELHSSTHDIIFFGTNKTYHEHNKVQVWGTHAMWISPRAKQLFLENISNRKRCEVDQIWNNLIVQYDLKVWVPPKHNMYVRQKIGLISSITGNARVNHS